MQKIRSFIVAHKIITGIIVIAVVWAGYSWYGATHGTGTVMKYVVQKATLGTVVASVSGSGQMQAVNTVDVKPQTSENVLAIPVQVGEQVSAGQVLVRLDTTAEDRALAQAKLQLQSAELSLAKLTETPATTTLIQDQNAVTQGQANIMTASTTLEKDYQAGFDSLTNTFVDFQNVMTGLQNFVLGNDISKSENDPDAYLALMPTYLQPSTQPYHDAVLSAYDAAHAAYQQNLSDYQAASRNSDQATLNSLFTETYHTAQSVSEAVKAVKNFLDYMVDNYPKAGVYAPLPSVTNTLEANMGNYTTTASGDVGTLLGAINAIAADQTALTNAELSLNQSSSTLATLLAGADPLDVQSSQLSVQQQELALQTAEQNLAYDSIRAPIDGVISAIPSVIGTSVPSPAVSMVGNQQIAEVTLNEIDAAKVQVGDKATVTFDALPDLSLAGAVVELDPVGTVSQGVVSYNAQIALATPNASVKPGMSVSADIVTQVAQDVVAVPNAAVVTQGGSSYVLEPASPLSDADIAASANGGVVLAAAPVRVPVTLGISNGTMTQILSGVNEGDEIVTQTLTTSASASSASTNPLRALGGGALGGGGGGAVFFRTGGGGGGAGGGAAGGAGR